MTRRDFVSATTMASLATAVQAADTRTHFDGTPPKTGLGMATTCFMTFAKPSMTAPGGTLAFLEHCHSLGAGGIQAALSSTDPADLKKLRSRAEQLGMYIETMAPFAKSADTSAFENALKASKEVGALAVRVGSSGGRRYEKWNSLEDWTAFLKESGTASQAMSQIAEKMKVTVGLENHKDWTYEEMLTGMKHLSNEYFGVLLDFGNNIALLDAPDALMDLIPYAKMTHVKDMALEPYRDGFLLSEVVLGSGMLDLPKIITAIREKQPKIRFTLEMITRDPLEVPCLTDKYWVTFPQRNGRYLARTLKLVQNETGVRQPLPRYKQLTQAAQLRAEEDNVKFCLNYARERLSL